VTLYVDTSVLLKRYVAEHDSESAEELLLSDSVLVTSRLTGWPMRDTVLVSTISAMTMPLLRGFLQYARIRRCVRCV